MTAAPFRPADLAVVIPVLNERPGIGACLDAVAALGPGEVIVVDADSGDGTATAVRDWIARHPATPGTMLLASPPGRAIQMNAGAARAHGRALLFLHADTRIDAGGLEAACAALDRGALWGRFDVRIEGRVRLLPWIARLMNLRSRLTGIATGDQCLFVRRDVFESVRGYAPFPLMEDLDLSRRLRRLGPPAALRHQAQTSGRRWEQRGALRTVVRMWALRLLWWLGADPGWLARRYTDVRDPC